MLKAQICFTPPQCVNTAYGTACFKTTVRIMTAVECRARHCDNLSYVSQRHAVQPFRTLTDSSLDVFKDVSPFRIKNIYRCFQRFGGLHSPIQEAEKIITYVLISQNTTVSAKVVQGVPIVSTTCFGLYIGHRQVCI